MRYTMDYRESVTLRDGTRICTRAIAPADKAAMARAFSRLSVETRRRRFHVIKNALSDDELRYLTECDGRNHYAIVAVLDGRSDAEAEGIGVARLFRREDDPGVAELAIVVVDEWQRRGVGRLLVERIARAAAERDIREIKALALADNEEVLALLRGVSAKLTIQRRDGLVEVSLPLQRRALSEALEGMFTVLELAALGGLVLPLKLGRYSLEKILFYLYRDSGGPAR